LFFLDFSRSIEFAMSWPEVADIGPGNIKPIHHPLEVCIRKNILTLYLGWGALGWVATAVGPFVSPSFF
jgi:hypothetical protein